MNQRIDQLLVKAGAYFGAEGVDYSNFEPKKFAELIVRECAGVSENHKGMNDKYFIADAIKKHFGIEE
jgi:hypothetical protein